MFCSEFVTKKDNVVRWNFFLREGSHQSVMYNGFSRLSPLQKPPAITARTLVRQVIHPNRMSAMRADESAIAVGKH
jgi:hypothetical protein